MRPTLEYLLAAVLLAPLTLLLSCSSSSTSAVATASTTASQWVVAWGASPENALAGAANPGGSEQSFRNFFYPTVAGTQERVHFSNLFGTTPITIGAAHLSAAGTTTAPAVDATLLRRTFSHHPRRGLRHLRCGQHYVQFW